MEFSIDELIEMVNEVSSWNGELEDLRYYINDEWFFKDFYSNNVDEAVRAVCYGDYNYMDDYVKWNAYGNLESCSELEYRKEIESYKEEIIEAFYRNIDNMWDKELKDKVLKYMKK